MEQRSTETEIRIYPAAPQRPWLQSRGAILLALVALLAGLLGSAVRGYAGCDLNPRGLCTRTSAAARIACRNEVRDDFWIAVGNCRNRASERAGCVAAARDERDEGREDCEVVCEARQDICDGLGQGFYDPVIDPADFVSMETARSNPNPWWPLTPGLVRIYETDEEKITVTILEETVEILGIECAVVRDVVEEDGVLIEDTIDWYAQDQAGNVWYFGEISQNFEDGELVNLDGSWKSGVDGAKPGIQMFADPQVGTTYRQEFALGNAEDYAEILSVTGDETTDVVDCEGACVVTLDALPFEPDVIEHKYYAAGVGLVVETKPGTTERLELTELIEP